MAKATTSFDEKIIEKVTTEVVKTPIVTLELTVDEAQAVYDIIGGHVVGCPRSSRRKLTSGVFEQFSKLEGSILEKCNTRGDIKTHSHGIQFLSRD